MSIVTLFTRKSPTIAGLEFDAVLEDTFEGSVGITSYPIESGARAADHRVIQPYRWFLTGAISNNPIKPTITDFTTLLSGNSGVGATFAGLFAGWLAGSDSTRASSALSFLIDLMNFGDPFDIDAGDIQLSNMIIVNLRRTKDASNEDALIFEAELQEYPTLETLLSGRSPKQFELPNGDPAKTQAAELINKGEQALRSAGQSVRNTISGLFG